MAPGPVAAQPYAWSQPTPYMDPQAVEHNKQIDRTKTGLLVILVGALIGWIPIIGGIGGLLIIIGAIFIIVGRKAFGDTHSRNVWIGVVLYIVGVVAAAIFVVIATFSLIGGFVGTGTPTLGEVESALTNILLGTVVGSAIIGLSTVVFTYALQKREGKILLWAGYIASVAIASVLVLILLGEVSVFAQDIAASGFDDPAALQPFSDRVEFLGLLEVIPHMLWAAATYLAWDRVKKREIPAQYQPQPMYMPPLPQQ